MGIEKTFDPTTVSDPVQALTLLLRHARVGDRVTMSNGTVVRSVQIHHGAHLERRYAVVPPGGTALERHRTVALGRGAFISAQDAARKALNKPKDND